MPSRHTRTFVALGLLGVFVAIVGAWASQRVTVFVMRCALQQAQGLGCRPAPWWFRPAELCAQPGSYLGVGLGGAAALGWGGCWVRELRWRSALAGVEALVAVFPPRAGAAIDAVSVARLTQMFARHPHWRNRLYGPGELAEAGNSPERLAARLAAKEATVKLLGGLRAARLRDVEVHHGPDGAPQLHLLNSAAVAAQARGLRDWEVSLTHDGGVGMAVVYATRSVATP